MKRITAWMLTAVLLALLLTGCTGSPSETTVPPETTIPAETTLPPETSAPTEPSEPENAIAYPQWEATVSELSVPETDWNDPEQAERWFLVTAENYIRKHINMAMLFHEGDFETGTLLSLEPTPDLEKMDFLIEGQNWSVSELRAALEHAVAMSDYCRLGRYLESAPEIEYWYLESWRWAVTVEENVAVVKLGCGLEYKLMDSTFSDEWYDGFKVYFVRIDGTWYVANVFQEVDNGPLEQEPVPEVDWNDPQQVEKWLETVAKNYVTKYIDTTWLLYTNDFETGTLLSLEPTPELENREFLIEGQWTPVSELRADLEHVVGMAEYYQLFRCINWLDSGVEKLDPILSMSAPEVTVEGDTAVVSFSAGIEYSYSNSASLPSGAFDSYRVYFAKIDGTWYIVNMYVSEFEYLGLTRDKFDPEEQLEDKLLMQAKEIARERSESD